MIKGNFDLKARVPNDILEQNEVNLFEKGHAEKYLRFISSGPQFEADQ